MLNLKWMCVTCDCPDKLGSRLWSHGYRQNCDERACCWYFLALLGQSLRLTFWHPRAPAAMKLGAFWSMLHSCNSTCDHSSTSMAPSWIGM